MKRALLAGMVLTQAWAGVVVGQKLPEAQVADKGLLVPATRVEGGRMVMAGKEIGHRPWHLADTAGKVRTIYHLAARMGIDDLNKPYIDALIAAHLPETLPDSPYKTLTILNLSEANFLTHGVGVSRFDKSQRETPYALFVADEKGAARAAWGLRPGTSAVIILDRDGTVLFFKEGKLSPEEIRQAVTIIQGKLK